MPGDCIGLASVLAKPGYCVCLSGVSAWLVCLPRLCEMLVSVLAWLVCLSVASFLTTLKGSIHKKWEKLVFWTKRRTLLEPVRAC